MVFRNTPMSIGPKLWAKLDQVDKNEMKHTEVQRQPLCGEMETVAGTHLAFISSSEEWSDSKMIVPVSELGNSWKQVREMCLSKFRFTILGVLGSLQSLFYVTKTYNMVVFSPQNGGTRKGFRSLRRHFPGTFQPSLGMNNANGIQQQK
jgi:hypothetical protein